MQASLYPGGRGAGGCTASSKGAGVFVDAALQKLRVGRRERHSWRCSAWLQESSAAQQPEQFPPVLGAPTRFASKKERSGAATGIISVPGTLTGAGPRSAKLSLSPSLPAPSARSSGSFNLTSFGGVLTLDSTRTWGCNVPITHIMGCSVLEVSAPTDLSFRNQLDPPSSRQTSRQSAFLF